MSDRADAKHSCLADKAAPPTVTNIADKNHIPSGLLKNLAAEGEYLRFRAFWILAYLGILGTANLAHLKNAIHNAHYDADATFLQVAASPLMLASRPPEGFHHRRSRRPLLRTVNAAVNAKKTRHP
jgi:hypothetical protein